MTEPIGDLATSTQIASTRKNPLSPKKLLLSKRTAVSPAGKERLFVVTRVVAPAAGGADRLGGDRGRAFTALVDVAMARLDRWQALAAGLGMKSRTPERRS